MSRTRTLIVVAIAAAAVTAATLVPVFAGDDNGLTLRPVADTTVSQVPQDGDNSKKTTLASCPSTCDGNRNGRRDATLQFAVDKIPANVTRVKATLRVYSWQNVTARILARTIPGTLAMASSPVQLAAAGNGTAVGKVVKGYNAFDVSASVQRNGTYTFALSQEQHHTRIYWASRENATEAQRPQLVLSYEAGGKPSATPSTPRTAMPPPTTAPPVGVPQGWRPVWADEFNGNALDRSRWNLRNNEGRDVDRGCNVDSPKNTFVGGGNLTLRVLREPATCSSQSRQYTQSYLDTIGLASFTYGRFEIRAKSPNQPEGSTGLWPAFWLRPDDGGNGEIDVTELPGGAAWYDKSTAGIFWDYTPVKQDSRLALPGGGHPGDGFHTYTTEWDATALKWYIDGKLVWTRDRTTTPWYDQAFRKPYNLRLNFQVGGWLGDPDEKTRFPSDFVVDYVRVYQR
jgi:beta-glucanase (GH16 family)